MVRTKHAVIGLAVLLAVCTGLLGSSWTQVPKDAFGFSEMQTANVIGAEEQKPEVIVLRDTTREDARADLREKLKAFVNDTAPIDGGGDAQGVTDGAVSLPPVPQSAPKSILCNPGVAPGVFPQWGPVDVSLVEGVRVIRSLALDTTGAPLHAVVLPIAPTLTGMTSCLPSGPIALLLDGTVVTPETQVRTDTSGLLGYALDGFPILGAYEEERVVTGGDLDVCHGHEHAILDQGALVPLYHYHVTGDEPYTLGCFRGTPVRSH